MDRRPVMVVRLHIIMWRFFPVRAERQPIMEFSINCIIQIQALVRVMYLKRINTPLLVSSMKAVLEMEIPTIMPNSTIPVTLMTSSSLTEEKRKKPKAASISRVFPMPTTHLKNRPVYPQTSCLLVGMTMNFVKARRMTSPARRCPHRTLRSTQSGRRRLLKLRFT